MKLSYRGIAYSSSSSVLEVSACELSGTYRGVPIKFSAQLKPYAPNSVVRLSYRGVDYLGLR